MIPRVIHYCWFGGNPKPEIVEKCIASWRRFCPDWKIIEWNETNYDVHAHVYISEAYALKMWAFVSDVVRLDVVYQYGGIYMDTDVELLAPIDCYLDEGAFFVFETQRNINTGMGFGAEKESKVIERMLSHYNERSFIINGKPDISPCPSANTEALCAAYPSFLRNGQAQRINGIYIMPYSEYSAIAFHYANGSWVKKDGDSQQKPYKDTRLKQWLREPRKFIYIENHLGKKAVSLYTIIAYDLLDYGLLYYIKKFFLKFIARINTHKK